MQIFISDLFMQLWDREKAHKAVGAVGWSKQCCQNMQNKGRTQKKEREKEGTNILWLESYWAFGAKGEWKAWKRISICNLQTLPYFHAQHLSHLANKWKIFFGGRRRVRFVVLKVIA